MRSDDIPKESLPLNLRVSALEADLAYFEARLELIGKPVTRYQWAQVKTFRALQESLKKILQRLKRATKQGEGKPQPGVPKRGP